MTPRDAGRVVVVGAGLAGFSAGEQLRALGHDGPILLVDPEPAAYDRPPLSKRLFADDFSLDGLAFADDDRLSALGIQTRFGRTALGLDPDAAAVTLDDGNVLEADTVLLATGGRARRLPIPGGDAEGVHVLRTFADALAIRRAVRPGIRAVVIGAGLVGAELASSLTDAGAAVTLVDPVPVPLAPAVGELMAAHLHAMHQVRGVDVVHGITAHIETEPALTVVVDDGPRVAADLVVVGIGISPCVELAQAAGLEVDDGILVDAAHRTSAPRVFAAGDVARQRDGGGARHRREEHWEAARLGGQAAAAGMLGLEAPPRGAGWFWSDRHGVHVEATGRLTGPGELVARHAGDHPAVFLVEDGHLVGAAAVDDTATVRAARRIIDKRTPVTSEELADPAIPLRALLRAAR